MYVLYKVTISTDDDNIFRLIPDDTSKVYGAQAFATKATPNQILKFLKRCGSADELTSPRSKRGITYQQIVDNIIDGNYNSIYVFSHKYPKNLQDFQRKLL